MSRTSRARRELFERILELVREVFSGRVDPFDVNVVQLASRLREEFPRLRGWDEINLDLEAMIGLAGVVERQEEWIEHRASRLFVDPLLVALKVEVMDLKELARMFLRAWRPIVEARGVTPAFLEAAVSYWLELPPASERGEVLPEPRGEQDFEPLWKEQEFEKRLMLEARRLQMALDEKEGEVSYSDYLRGKDPWDSAERAYLLSFLISDGVVSVRRDPATGELFLVRPRGSGDSAGSIVTWMDVGGEGHG